MFWKNKYPYTVILNVSGRHPYLKSHGYDFFEGKRLEELDVMAYSWKDAENQALKIGPKDHRYWSYRVAAIVRR